MKNDKRTISVVIPYYRRSDMIMETIIPILDDERISEIILCDDCSPAADFRRLRKLTDNMKKVKVVRNVINFGNQHNKKNCLSFATNKWAIILDNDNIITSDFVDCLYNINEWNEKVIYHPDFARTHFDYRKFSGKKITRINVREFCEDNIFMTLLNTNNYFVNKKEYLNVYEYDRNIKGADGIFFAHNWLKNGNVIEVVKGMQYFHRVHDDSCFLANSSINMKLITFWLNKVKLINEIQ